jgi:hypothetical protein
MNEPGVDFICHGEGSFVSLRSSVDQVSVRKVRLWRAWLPRFTWPGMIALSPGPRGDGCVGSGAGRVRAVEPSRVGRTRSWRLEKLRDGENAFVDFGVDLVTRCASLDQLANRLRQFVAKLVLPITPGQRASINL